MRMGHMRKADLMSTFARRHPHPISIMASVAVSTTIYFRLKSPT